MRSLPVGADFHFQQFCEIISSLLAQALAQQRVFCTDYNGYFLKTIGWKIFGQMALVLALAGLWREVSVGSEMSNIKLQIQTFGKDQFRAIDIR